MVFCRLAACNAWVSHQHSEGMVFGLGMTTGIDTVLGMQTRLTAGQHGEMSPKSRMCSNILKTSRLKCRGNKFSVVIFSHFINEQPELVSEWWDKNVHDDVINARNCNND